MFRPTPNITQAMWHEDDETGNTTFIFDHDLSYPNRMEVLSHMTIHYPGRHFVWVANSILLMQGEG